MWRADSSNTPAGSHGSGRSGSIATPCCDSRLTIVAISASAGRLVRTSGSAVSRLAAISGSAAFLAPPILIVPHNGTPPRIRILSIASAPHGNGRSRLTPRRQPSIVRLLLSESLPPLKPAARRLSRQTVAADPPMAFGREPVPCGGADSRATPAPAAQCAAPHRGREPEAGEGSGSSHRWKGVRTGVSTALDAQADLGGENYGDRLACRIFGRLVG